MTNTENAAPGAGGLSGAAEKDQRASQHTVVTFPVQHVAYCVGCHIDLRHGDRDAGNGYCRQCADGIAQAQQRARDRAALEGSARGAR